MDVVFVELVDIHGLARALADGAEGLFPQASDFPHRVRQGGVVGRVNLHFPVRHEQALGRQGLDLRLQNLGRNGRGDFLQRRVRAGQAGHPEPFELLLGLGAVAEDVGLQAQVFDGLGVRLELVQTRGLDRLADAQFHRVTVHTHQFAHEERRAEFRVDEARGLKEVAVAADDVDRDDRCLGAAGDGGDVVVPRRIAHAALAEAQVRDRARGEGADAAAVLEELQHLLERGDVRLGGAGAAERIDRDEGVVELRNLLEHVVHDELHVVAHRGQKRAEHHAVQRAVRVVRHDDHRALAGDEVAILRTDDVVRAHRMERAVKEIEFPGELPRPGVDVVHPADRKRALNHGRKHLEHGIVKGLLEVDQLLFLLDGRSIGHGCGERAPESGDGGEGAG